MNNLFSLDNTTNITNLTQLNTLIITKYGWLLCAILIHYMMNSGNYLILQAIIYIKISPEKAILGWLRTLYMNRT